MSLKSGAFPLFGLLVVVVMAVALVRGTFLLGFLVLLFAYCIYMLTKLVEATTRLADSADRIATQLEADR